MTSHFELLTELQQLDKVPSLERLRAAQKRRTQQLKRWAVYEKEMKNKKQKTNKWCGNVNHKNVAESHKRVSFAANVTLLEASARNDLEEVRYLLKNSVNPDLCNEDGLTAMHQCCIDNYEDMVRLLVDRGASVNAQDNELWTPLHAAATCGHTGLVRILIQHNADLLAVNSDGNMPYDLCEDDSTLDIIETAMANRGITQEMINETRAAVERRMLGDIQNILHNGEDINQHDSQRATLLHIAAANGYMQAAELLLEGGAKMDLRDSEGWQPLHAAACWGQMYVAELLVSHGASLNAKTYMEETPIDLCEDEDFRNHLLDLKQKHDIILKSQLKHKTSLCRRTSSAGSRGKVVRRASLSNRHKMCQKEYETEAIVWRGGKEEEDKEETEKESYLENTNPVKSVKKHKEPHILKDGDKQNYFVSTTTSAMLLPTSDSDSMTIETCFTTISISSDDSWPREPPKTLSELKKQRAAAKLLSHPILNGNVSNGSMATTETKDSFEDPCMPCMSSNGTTVFFTPASGDPPLLKLKQSVEEEDTKSHGCCCIL